MATANVHALAHPLVSHHLAALRDRRTPPAEFRQLIRRLTFLLAFEATADLATDEVTIETPLTSTTARQLRGRIAVVPILRAGMGMVEAVLDLIPGAEVWHFGMFRDEKTLRPVQYYNKMPTDHPPDLALVLDPMLATGGSANWALDAMKQWGVGRVKQLSIIASQPGLDTVAARHPEVPIHVCAIDAKLNEHGYIVPGLGDAGDRTYHTTPGH